MRAAFRGFTREPTLASFTFERKARYPTHGPTDRTAPEATSLLFIRHEIAESSIRRTSTQASGDVRALPLYPALSFYAKSRYPSLVFRDGTDSTHKKTLVVQTYLYAHTPTQIVRKSFFALPFMEMKFAFLVKR